MKTFGFLLVMAFIAGGSFIKPSDKKLSTEDIINYSEACSTGDTVIVPVAIRTSFDTKYPKATRVVWYQYVPDKTMNTDPALWYAGLDDKDYYVTFSWNDADYIAWYDNGQWIRSSQMIDDIDLPADVMRAINTQYPAYRITDVDLERDNKQELYEVKLVKGDTKMNVHFTSNGTVARKKERHMAKSDPQTDLTGDFTTRFPDASDVVWYRYTPDERVEVLPTDWDFGMDASDYEVRFKRDGSDHIAWYNDGKWVRSEVVMSNPAKLPANINTAIQTQYSGYTIKDVETEYNTNRTVYEVELTKGNEKCKVHYTSDGAIIKKKCKTT